MHFGRFWAPFGLPFRSLSLLLGTLWLPFGSLLVPVGSLLVALGSLLVTLALDFLTFGASWRLFYFSFIVSIKFSCKFIFFGKRSLKLRLFFVF